MYKVTLEMRHSHDEGRVYRNLVETGWTGRDWFDQKGTRMFG